MKLFASGPVITLLTSLFLLGSTPVWAQSTDHDGHDHQSPEVEIDIDHALDEAPDDHTLGSETAPVSMIIYASVTCPHCADWFSDHWPEFKAAHVDNGDVRVIFREFPTPPAPLAMAGFLIANCAGEDGFFDHVVHQMQTQEEIFSAVQAGNGQATYNELGKMAGLESEEDMTACFATEEHFARIQRAMMRARASGIGGVPAFVIDGEIFKDDANSQNLSDFIGKKLKNGLTPLPGK